MAVVLIDTGYWFAHFNQFDDHHKEIDALLPILESSTVLIPWPTLYETINSKFSKGKGKKWLYEFERIVKRPNFHIIEDEPYKEIALRLTFDRGQNQKFDLSLVDNVIRQMLADESLRIDFLITFNKNDFRDICVKRSINIDF